MTNWLQYWRFCILDIYFAHNVAIFHLSAPPCPIYDLESADLLLCPFYSLCSVHLYGFTVFVFSPLILDTISPFLHLFVSPTPIYDIEYSVLLLWRLSNHLFSSFLDFQRPKWRIDLKIEDFVFFTYILHTMWPYSHLSGAPCPIYDL